MALDPIGQTLYIFETLAKSLAPGMEALGVQWYIFWFVFFLSYVLIYSLLNFIHFLKDNNNAKLVVALVIAFIIASNGWALAIIGAAFPSLGVLLAVGLSIMILVALFIPDLAEKNMKLFSILAFIFIVLYVVSLIFTSGAVSSSSGFGEVSGFLETYLGVIIAIFIIIGLIMFLRGGIKGTNDKKGSAVSTILDLFKENR